MNIISGQARGLVLAAPPTLAVRPTAGRARKALFDSLGNFAGLRVLDLAAGSGALGLEAASRGADAVCLIEKDRGHVAFIERNILAVRKTGVTAELTVLAGDLLDLRLWRDYQPDLIFADPPYGESSRLFHELQARPEFAAQAAGARLVWEIPDIPGAMGEFIGSGLPAGFGFREFGGTAFLIGRLPRKGGKV